MTFDATTPLATILDHSAGRAVVSRHAPGVINSPMAGMLRGIPLGMVVSRDPVLQADPAAVEALWAELAEVDDSDVPVRVEAPAIAPDTGYDDAAAVPAALRPLPEATLWGTLDIAIDGPSHGNPFVDVELTATVTDAAGTLRTVGGFYDGGGTWRLRYLPLATGEHTLVTSSTSHALDRLTATFTVGEALPGEHGPVRVADTFHFAHADGTRHLPLGTTVYALSHQGDEVEERTLATLAASPFTKVRLCVFPKAYLYNANEPERYPFERDENGDWDTTRFDPEYFQHFERRVSDLAALGIQADVILFHAYDRWGFSDLGKAADDRYLSYVTRRLQAYPTVWWSLANEYDLLWGKSIDDWERFAAVIGANDPVGHLTSIHNCFGFYDYTRPWITHSSVQRIDVYRTAENTDAWREEWGKPVVIDECAYEGDIDQGWGNITGEEMTRRFWEGAIRGGYVGHGETYLNDEEELWWSKGGELVGSSPARIAFLRSITEAMPEQRIDPLPGDWDTPWGGSGTGVGAVSIAYFGFNRPRFRTIAKPESESYEVDVIDTWNMTVERVPGTFSGSFRVELPARQYMAIRLTRVE